MCAKKNTDSKSGQMEPEAAVALFERSLSRHGLRYTTMLCDGDSRSFRALEEAKVYGYINVEKEDCINHVQKRMGTALRNLIQKHKTEHGESLSGKGRLTGDLITKLTNYNGWALKLCPVSNIDGMYKAVLATYHHICSTGQHPYHSLCPQGANSWRKQNAATARGEPLQKHRSLPEHISKALLPVYERLADKELLQRCHRGKDTKCKRVTAFCDLVPNAKTKHASLFAVETALTQAVMRYNAGTKKASSHIL